MFYMIKTVLNWRLLIETVLSGNPLYFVPSIIQILDFLLTPETLKKFHLVSVVWICNLNILISSFSKDILENLELRFVMVEFQKQIIFWVYKCFLLSKIDLIHPAAGNSK